MKVSERFNRALRRLTGAFVSHLGAPREPGRVTELAASRARLEDARTEMADIRRDEGLVRPERSSPRWFDPRIGLGDSSWIGKAGAVLGAALLAAALLLAAKAVFDLRGSGDLELVDGSLTELVEPVDDGTCQWIVAMEIESNAAEQVQLRTIRIEGISQSSMTDATGFEDTSLRTGDGTFAQVVTRLPACPEAAADIDHGPLVVTYDRDGTRPIQTIQLSF